MSMDSEDFKVLPLSLRQWLVVCWWGIAVTHV